MRRECRRLLTRKFVREKFYDTMKTASVRDIRQNLPRVMAWIADGELVTTAILCKARVFLSTDARQRKVAKAAGLEVKPGNL